MNYTEYYLDMNTLFPLRSRLAHKDVPFSERQQIQNQLDSTLYLITSESCYYMLYSHCISKLYIPLGLKIVNQISIELKNNLQNEYQNTNT